jgi:hypothetical protein
MKAAAASASPITYSGLLTAMESRARPNSRYLTEILCEISATSLMKERSLLSAVVVNAGGKRKGIPGSGFFVFAKRQGLEVSDERAFWNVEVEKVYSAFRDAAD